MSEERQTVKKQKESRRPMAPEPKESATIGNPRYFSCSIRPSDPRKKSQITLYTVRAPSQKSIG
jgi:hypothetical protein